MSLVSCTRLLEFCAGHRVFGHENKCARPHGHNYRAEVTACAESLDEVGRVIDFACIKETLGSWINVNWDHRFLVWANDLELIDAMSAFDCLCVLPRNPTAENLADMLRVTGNDLLQDHMGIRIQRVRLWETQNCFADAVTPRDE